MKLKINKRDQNLIRDLKKVINNNRKTEDQIIADLASRMMLTPHEEEILWDYIQNDSHWMVELENK